MTSGGSELLTAADEAYQRGDLAAAWEAYTREAAAWEVPPGAICVRLMRCARAQGDTGQALRWALAVVDGGDDAAAWQAAAGALPDLENEGEPVRRRLRTCVTGSATTDYLVPLLRLASRRLGIVTDVHETGYGQYRQELLAPSSALHRFDPDVIVLAVDSTELALPEHSDNPDTAVTAELQRWASLWEAVQSHSHANVVQHGFVLDDDPALGHLAAGLPTTRYRMAAALSERLMTAAPAHVSFVDCERLAARFGKRRWRDLRYWYLAKLAVSFEALPLLARHTAAVLAAQVGLSRKALVVDLDHTLWGGVVGEDGVAGLVLGEGPDGEAFAAFQSAVGRLRERGIVLAACSKNDEHVVREVFDRHPGMRLRWDDFAVVVCNWESKVDNLRTIATALNLGVDSLVFADDNPVERQEVRRFLPDVDVLCLPHGDPASYTRVLGDYPGFEVASFTREDARRAASYQARAQAEVAARTASSIEDFYRDLAMRAVLSPFVEDDLPRIVQLIAKTNQFNLTTSRLTLAEVRASIADPATVHLTLRLRDRFTDHGLVGLAIAVANDGVLDIRLWLMSCRVIGRTAEQQVLAALADAARKLGCGSIEGTYLPTAKNGLVADLYERLGFTLLCRDEGGSRWRLDLSGDGPAGSPYIDVVELEAFRDAS